MRKLESDIKSGFLDDPRFDPLRACLLRDVVAYSGSKKHEHQLIDEHKAFACTLLTPFRPEIISIMTKKQQIALYRFVDDLELKKNVGLMGKIKTMKFEEDLGL